MSIQRVPDVPFAQIANSALRDKRLSFKARGVLALALSNVGEWSATLDYFIDNSDHDGKAAVQAALNELTELGYRSVTKESDGKAGMKTVVVWRHVPEHPIIRPPNNTTVVKIDRRETGGSLEDHRKNTKEQNTKEPDASASSVTTIGNQHAKIVADAIYEHTNGMGNYNAIRQVAVKAVKKFTPEQVIRAMKAAHDDGRPLTGAVVDQYLTGKVKGRAADVSGARDPFAAWKETSPWG